MDMLGRLINDIEAFCLTKVMTEREFCDVAGVHPRFMRRLRQNTVTSRSMVAADRFVAEHADTPPAALRVRVNEVRAKDTDATPIKEPAPHATP